jgi:uncharacterized membrane protein
MQVIVGIFLVAIGDLVVILEPRQPIQAASDAGPVQFSFQTSMVGFAMIFVGLLLLVAHVFTMPI